MVLTRCVKYEWSTSWGQTFPEYAEKRDQKIIEMLMDAKTDGIPITEQDFVVNRFFTDDVAAQEWVDWLVANHPPENVPTIIEITEVNIPV